MVGWLFLAVSQREGERRERIDESKNVQTTPTRSYCKRNRPLSYCNQNCRTARHWKFTQHHRTTRPPRGTQERVRGKRAIKVRTGKVLLYFKISLLKLRAHNSAYMNAADHKPPMQRLLRYYKYTLEGSTVAQTIRILKNTSFCHMVSIQI